MALRARRYRGHPGLCGGLRSANAGELRRRLHPPPRRDGHLVRLDGDAVRSKPIGNRDRHLRVGDRRPDTHRGGTPRRELQIELVMADPRSEELMEAEVGEGVEHRIGRCDRNSRVLELADGEVHLPADDGEQKGVSDRDGELVAHRRRAFRITVKHKIGHRAEAVSRSVP